MSPFRLLSAQLIAVHLVPWFSTMGVAAEDKPNIVLLLADDLGWTGLGCFGSDLYETPNLDALAQRGVKFTNAYSACTVCSPTRASIMTGQYPARLHLTDFIAGQNRPFAKMRIPEWTKYLDSDHNTVAEILKQAGYRTGHIGKWHLEDKSGRAAGTRPLDQGFDYSFERPAGSKGYIIRQKEKKNTESAYLTDVLTDKACEFINQSRANPFFLYFAYNVPHTPIQGRPDLVERFKAKVKPGGVHTNPVYAAMVASLDQSVGRIIRQLETLGLADDTLIVFISDNGGLTQRYGRHDNFTENLPLRRGKGSAYEGGIRVPAIAYWPGVINGGTVCAEPIITSDLFPTFVEVSGAVRPPETICDGHSLVSLFRVPSVPIDRDLFWHYPHYHAGGDGPYSAIRSGSFRLIEFHEDNRVMLFDLSKDIGEQHDLAAKMPAKTESLRKKLRAWRANVGAQMPRPNPDYDPGKQQEVARKRNK